MRQYAQSLSHSVGPSTAEDLMSEQHSAADKSLAHQTSPYGYAYWEWVAREDPEYAKARIPLSELSVGEGKALAIKYREMVIIGILAFRGASQEGMLAHMRRAIQHAAGRRGGVQERVKDPEPLMLLAYW